MEFRDGHSLHISITSLPWGFIVRDPVVDAATFRAGGSNAIAIGQGRGLAQASCCDP
jgi:hypothetical protein